MRKLYNIIFSFLLLGCVQDEDFSVPPLECNDPNLSQTITAVIVWDRLGSLHSRGGTLKSSSWTHPRSKKENMMLYNFLI